MKVVRSNLVPFRGFSAINLFGVVFVRKDLSGYDRKSYARMLRHEYTHTKQMRELLFLPFYLWYVTE